MEPVGYENTYIRPYTHTHTHTHIYIYIERERIDCKKLACAIRKAQKSPDMLATSWRPTKACGIIQPKSEGLKTRHAEGRRTSVSRLKA